MIRTRIVPSDVAPPTPLLAALAVTDSLLILPLHYYKKEDSPEQNLWKGRDWIDPVPIVPLRAFASSHDSYVLAAPGSNWLLQKLIVHDRPARLLPIFTDTKDIQGFTPPAHGPVWLFAEGSFSDLPPVDARVT